MNLLKVISGLVLGAMASLTAQAATVTLDAGNGYSAELETGVLLARQVDGSGPISLTGGVFAIGNAESAVFGNQNRIGGEFTDRLDGNRPRDLAANSIAFAIRANDSGNLYNLLLTYFGGDRQSAGVPPMPLNGATAVFDVNAVTPIPVPAALPLMLSALGGFGVFARRRGRVFL
ncbi:MAG: VPLPA-CTERM sorting domain-containing protein [Pseudomonadota bacterium]